MVVDYLDFGCDTFCLTPDKTYPPLVVDSDTVLTFSIPLQLFKSIPRWNIQITGLGSNINRPEFPPTNDLDFLGKFLNEYRLEYPFRVLVGETP